MKNLVNQFANGYVVWADPLAYRHGVYEVIFNTPLPTFQDLKGYKEHWNIKLVYKWISRY